MSHPCFLVRAALQALSHSASPGVLDPPRGELSTEVLTSGLVLRCVAAVWLLFTRLRSASRTRGVRVFGAYAAKYFRRHNVNLYHSCIVFCLFSVSVAYIAPCLLAAGL
eukprot:COSAG02_NODE_144_length_34086_cov_65.390944_27_plen_109_part_00